MINAESVMSVAEPMLRIVARALLRIVAHERYGARARASNNATITPRPVMKHVLKIS